MCDGKRFHVCKKLHRWSALNRSSRAGERERSIAGLKRPRIRGMSELFRRVDGERRDPVTVVAAGAGPRPWKG